MLVALDGLDDAAQVCAAVQGLPRRLQDASDAVLLSAGPGGSLPKELQHLSALEQGALWRAGVLVPTATVSPGARIDPLRYAGRCRVNPVLAERAPLPDLRSSEGHAASVSPSRARWDAVVLAAAAEAAPLRVNKTGEVHKEDEKRLLHRRPGGVIRWRLAYALARAGHLLQVDGNLLRGRPEARMRRVRDPSLISDEASIRWASRLLLRLAGSWLPLEALSEALETRLPGVLAASGQGPRGQQLRRWLGQAADTLQRLDALEVERDPDGPVAFRARSGRHEVASGGLVTSDLEVFVAPGELEPSDHGRLCRLAPYADGDVVYRHRLTEDGLRRDRLHGGTDPHGFLQRCSRRPVPASVATAFAEWQRRAGRVVLWSGATVIEEDGVFRTVPGTLPEGAWTQRNGPDAPTQLEVKGDRLFVPRGHAPLRLRRAITAISRAVVQTEEGWEADLEARELADPDSVQAVLSAAHGGPLPGSVRIAVWGGLLGLTLRPEPATLLRIPRALADALLDDAEAGPLLQDVPGQGAVVVTVSSLPLLRARLDKLGLCLPEG